MRMQCKVGRGRCSGGGGGGKVGMGDSSAAARAREQRRAMLLRNALRNATQRGARAMAAR